MKSIKKITVLLLCVIAFASCSKDESIPNESIDNQTFNNLRAFADLNAQLDDLNSTFVMQSSTLPELRWSWKKFWKIAKADLTGAGTGAGVGNTVGGIGGAIVGGIIGAVVYSLEAAQTQSAVISGNNTTGNALVFDISDAREDSIGYYHNLIITALIQNNPQIINASADEKMNAVVDQVQKYFPDEMTKFNISNFRSNILSNLESDIEILTIEENPFPTLAQRYPELQSEFVVMEKYVTTVSSLNPELQEDYSAAVIQIVDKSDISSTSSSVIKSAVSVGINSSRLWE
ncbi:MAG: hypothetical protein LBN18_02565 [Dysgonamonadaceae bacterium]|jgi:hypothetical protein|nr:hypothetical protein [Dysgonamonadaceae bacterium]